MNSNRTPAYKSSILIVDDKPENLRLLSAILSEKGYKVRRVLNGQIALTACQTSPPDLVLLDINMPGMNGYEVCKKLKASEQTGDIPVIFISAMDDVWDKVEAFSVGGVDYITKPFQIEEVLVRVENQLTIQRLHAQLKAQNARLQQEICDRLRVEAELQQANQELKRLASLDGLTRIANRRHFDERLQLEWRRLFREKSSLSLILCDIDEFKNYNDTYGHLAGDYCLRQVASAISEAVKRSGDLVARYGGEEFAVILPNTTADGAACVAEDIKQELHNLKIPHPRSCVSEYVTLSLGLSSTVPTLKNPPDALIAVADTALYEAKQQGKNRIIVKKFEPLLSDSFTKKNALSSDSSSAIFL